jgi:predicted AlkP superfamily phosphohydrolase/phosphomutase
MMPLITKAASQNLVPGSHRGATGTFLMRSSRRVAYDTIDLHDITPTILDLMNVAHPRRYDGRTALAGKKMPIY